MPIVQVAASPEPQHPSVSKPHRARRSPPRTGRPPVSDRAALTGIIFVLISGCPWEYLPKEMGWGYGMTRWRRLRDWQEAGAWKNIDRVLLEQLQQAGESPGRERVVRRS